MTKKKKNNNQSESGSSKPALVGNRNQPRTQHITASYHGPIPLPAHLREYDLIVPGSAERLIAMAERQAEHRQYLEKSVVESEIKDSRMGLWFGFIISIIALVGATICAVVGQFGVAIAMGGGSIAALVSVFIYGSSTRRKERENKYKAEVDD